jgi:uncharacterized protein (DUF1697 family)
MTQYVAFLRAVNVAGHARVSMSGVRDAFVAAGCKGVRTFIQSGNVVFEAPERSAAAVLERVRTRLRKLLGEEPGLLVRTVPEIEAALRAAPFKQLETDARIKLYVAFIFEKPSAKPRFPLVSAKEALEAVGMKNLDVFIVSRRKRNGFYGFPNNFIEQELGVRATSRNRSTLSRILAFLKGETGA